MSVRTSLRPPPLKPKEISDPREEEEWHLTPPENERTFITPAKSNSEANNKAIGYGHIYAPAGLIQRVEAWLETLDL